jgi:hypothetical protein
MAMECKGSLGATLVCEDDYSETMPWFFNENDTSYTRAFLAGPPTDERNDPNISIAYGTCTKF